MAIIQNDDVIRVTFCCQHAGQNGINIRLFKVVANGGGTTTEQMLADGLAALISPKYRALLSVEAQFFGLKLKRILPLAGLAYEATSKPLINDGTAVGEPLVNQACGLVQLQTGIPGRKFRGRFYMPFPSEGQSVPPGVPTVAYQASLQAEFAFLGTNFQPGVLDPAVVLQAILLPTLAGVPTPVPIRSVMVADSWATQRRRSLINKGDVDPF